MLDVDRLAEAVLAGTRALIAKELAPLRDENTALRLQNDALVKRIEAVEAKPEPVIPTPLTLEEVTAAAERVTVDGVAKALEAYDATAREAVQAAIDAIPAPPEVVIPTPLTMGEVTAAVERVMADGIAKALEEYDAQAKASLRDAIAAIPAPPEPVFPVTVTLEEVREAAKAVSAEVVTERLEGYAAKTDVRDAIAAIPEPKPVDVKAALAGIEADVARLWEQMDALPAPVEPQHGRDGRGIKAASITAAGDLSLTYTDGTEETLGRVRGADADPADVQRLKEAVAELRGWKDAIRIPDAIQGKDGRGIASAKVNDDGELVLKFTDGDTQSLGRVRGEDGAHGFDLNALDVEFDGERTLSFAWPDGARKDFHIPTPIYRGVWKEGTYQRGDVVTWGGSQFTAIADTDAKPETDGTWRLSVKRGRDGAEVVKAERKPAPVKVGGGDAG